MFGTASAGCVCSLTRRGYFVLFVKTSEKPSPHAMDEDLAAQPSEADSGVDFCASFSRKNIHRKDGLH